VSVASRYLRPAVEPGRSEVRRRLSRSLRLVVTPGVGACSTTRASDAPVENLGEPAVFPTLETQAQTSIVGGNRLTSSCRLNGEQIYPANLRAITSVGTRSEGLRDVVPMGPAAVSDRLP
jgi:hypothetical protein